MGSSVVETTGKKKLSGTAKGYIILVGLDADQRGVTSFFGNF